MKKQSLRKKRVLKLIGLAIAGSQFWGLGSCYGATTYNVTNIATLDAAIDSYTDSDTIKVTGIVTISTSEEIDGGVGNKPVISVDAGQRFEFTGAHSSTISNVIMTGSSSDLSVPSTGSNQSLIWSGSGHRVDIKDSIFMNANRTNGTGTYGGAVFNAHAPGTVSGNQFISNNASTYGGAIYAQPGAEGLELIDNVFRNNTAGINAGAFSNDVDNVIVSGNTFDENEAKGSGGAISTYGSNVEIVGNTFSNNKSFKNTGGVTPGAGANGSAAGGGAIMNRNNGSGGKGVLIDNNVFVLNGATANGGAVYNQGDEMKIMNNVFEGNEAGRNGGAFYNEKVTPINQKGYGKDVEILGGNLFRNNTAGQNGGAIFNMGENLTIMGDNLFESNTAGGNGGAIYAYTSSDMTLNATGGNIIFEGNRDSGGLNDIYMEDSTALKIEGDEDGMIYFGGGVESKDGTAQIAKEGESEVVLGKDSINENFTGTYTQTDGTLTNYSTSFFGGTNTISNSNLNLWQAADLTIGNLTLNNANVNSLDGVITKTDVGTFAASGTNDFKIDINGNNETSDNFMLAGTGSGTFNISEILVSGAPTKEEIPLQVFDGSAIGGLTFEESVNQPIKTPIYSYGFRSDGSGKYTLFRGALNDQALRGQVATLSSYQSQLSVNNLLFEHVYLEGSVWFKPYGISERLYFTQGVKADSDAYGGIVGVDFKTVRFKNGGKFLPTVYGAYNGGKQSFSDVDMHQNGGQAGFRGVYQKGNYTGTALAYAGGYSNKMAVAGTVDRTNNWFAGVAVKNAYDFRTTSSEHLVLRPSLAVSYNVYGRQSWTSEFGEGVGMGTGYLNGVNIAPGMSFVYEKDTWSAHLTAQYVYNINDNVSGNVEGAELPVLKMRQNYFEYGLGATKKWRNDRLMSQAEVLFRDGGRVGVGYQLGLSIKF